MTVPLGSSLPSRSTEGDIARPRKHWLAPGLVVLLLCCSCTATKYVELRSTPRSPLTERLKLTSSGGPQASRRTMQTLRQFDLLEVSKSDPVAAADKLQVYMDRQPSLDTLYALAELNFVGAKKLETSDKKAAINLYGAAVANSYLYLFDERFTPVRNPYDPEYRAACDIYNGALENSMRIVRQAGGLLPGKTHTIESESQNWNVTVVVKGGRWRPEDFDRFEFVSDYKVAGLQNHFHSYGLGVPLIAVRKNHAPSAPDAQFFPPELSFPVTALLRVLPDNEHGPDAKTHNCVLELYDPLAACDIVLGGRRVPLETDLSTPLAYFLNDPKLAGAATEGLLNPDQAEKTRGLYMLEPYTPGKIPVLMVHGLWSSPLTWMEMFNDLRSMKEIREHYQFWFYEYPTGQPFWDSAAHLRDDLAKMREVLDPTHSEPALDQMVLVGHSMGGLLSKLQVVDSGDEFWRTVSDEPLEKLQLPDDTKQDLAREFYFKANPSVRRVITIATPHRGSKFANDTTRWLAQKLITLPKQVVRDEQQLYKDNPGVIHKPSPIQVVTSIDSLAPSVQLFPVLLNAPRPTWVKLHNIVGEVPQSSWITRIAGRGDKGTDGAVSYESAHLDNVDSELVVTADHLTVHRHPLSVLEVRRILLLHLDELRSGVNDNGPNGQGPRIVPVGGPPTTPAPMTTKAALPSGAEPAKAPEVAGPVTPTPRPAYASPVQPAYAPPAQSAYAPAAPMQAPPAQGSYYQPAPGEPPLNEARRIDNAPVR